MRRVVALTTAIGTAVLGFAWAPSALAAPAPVDLLLTRAGDGQVQLGWAATPATVRLVYKQGAPPTSADDPAATPVPLATGATSATVTGLTDGTAYVFSLSAVDASGDRSPATLVTLTPHVPVAGTVTMASSRATVGPLVRTTVATLSGRYTDGSHTAAPGVRIRLESEPAAGPWTTLTTVVTDAQGEFRKVVSPHLTTRYRAVVVASPYDAAVTSATRTITLRPTVTAAVPAITRVGTTVTVTGVLRPIAGGHGVRLQTLVDGHWRTIASATTVRTGTFRLRFVPEAAATAYPLRVVAVATPAQAAAISHQATTAVLGRTLASGSHGADVLAVQRALTRLHYDVGALDGRFGYDLLHAVVPFQKLNGLSLTGKVDAATVRAFAAPRAPKHWFPISGRSVEVDKTRQVLVLWQGRSLYRILDTSTGSGLHYWQNGVEETAVTPEGAFKVERKINGMRISPLGELWRPSYFYRGYAIHGSPSVPTHAASHGCVRITNPAVDRYYDWLTIGTRVYVFH